MKNLSKKIVSVCQSLVFNELNINPIPYIHIQKDVWFKIELEQWIQSRSVFIIAGILNQGVI